MTNKWAFSKHQLWARPRTDMFLYLISIYFLKNYAGTYSCQLDLLGALFLRTPFFVPFQVKAEQRRTSREVVRRSNGQMQRRAAGPGSSSLSSVLCPAHVCWPCWPSVAPGSPCTVWLGTAPWRRFPFLHHFTQESNIPDAVLGAPVSLTWITCQPKKTSA